MNNKYPHPLLLLKFILQMPLIWQPKERCLLSTYKKTANPVSFKHLLLISNLFIQLKETSNGYIILFKIICFVLIYLCIRKLLRITFLFIPGIKQYVWIRKQLNTLNDRIHTVIDEETPPLAEGSQGFINITFGKRRKKNYPIAEVREIESELIDILSHFDRIINAYTLKFVIVFDELDKIDPEMSNKEPEDELFATFEGTANGFPGIPVPAKGKTMCSASLLI